MLVGLIVYFVVVRRRRPIQSGKGKTIESLHLEANRLRKDVNNRWQQILAGKVSVPELNQNYLVAKVSFLTEIARFLDTYSMWIKGKSLQIDDDEVQRYQKLIEWVRKMMP